MKRRGTACNYVEALETLEAEQVGDRGDPLTRTVSADDTARIVAHYQRENDNAPMRVNRVDTVRMAWARMDNQPYTAYAQPDNWKEAVEAPKQAKRKHTANIGKVMGTMYAELEHRQEQEDPASECANSVIQKNLKLFFADYKNRLSKTAKNRLDELIRYVNRKSGGDAEKAKEAVDSLTTREGREAPETAKLSGFAHRLHMNFPHKDSVTCPELVGMLVRDSNGYPEKQRETKETDS
jgi:hypothetical protein